MTDAFLLAPCPSCGRDPVLLAWTLIGDALTTCCLHCDAPIDRASARAAAADELAAHGYDVPGLDTNPHGERGCRDGHCGVRQPRG